MLLVTRVTPSKRRVQITMDGTANKNNSTNNNNDFNNKSGGNNSSNNLNNTNTNNNNNTPNSNNSSNNDGNNAYKQQKISTLSIANAKTNAQNKQLQEADYDLNTPCWFYLDSSGLRQGPFSFREMLLWWRASYFSHNLPVKSVWQTEFTSLGDIPEFSNVPQSIVEKIEREQETSFLDVPPQPVHLSSQPPPDKFEQNAMATFNKVTGTITTPAAPDQPSKDREFRMLSRYFDYNQYQAQMNATKDEKKQKLIQGSKKFWKKKKEEKKRAKLVAQYLKD